MENSGKTVIAVTHKTVAFWNLRKAFRIERIAQTFGPIFVDLLNINVPPNILIVPPWVIGRHVRGEMRWDQNLICLNHKCRSDWTMIRTIAHEFIHWQQCEEGRLLPSSDDHTITWEGKVFQCKEWTDEEYFSLPWEVEAWRWQGPLANKAIAEAIKRGLI